MSRAFVFGRARLNGFLSRGDVVDRLGNDLQRVRIGTAEETQPEEDPSVLARLKRLEEHYTAHGMRRTCEGILVCHEHNHPHILMLQIANAFGIELHFDEQRSQF